MRCNTKKEYFDFMQTMRQELHSCAEKSHLEFLTQTKLKQYSTLFDCQLIEIAGGGLIFYFDFGKAHSIMFRAEQDGLPIREKTNLPFACTNGNMHACGHDGHMAICLGLAMYLTQQKKQNLTPPFNVSILFQPAEEDTGGAQSVIQSGFLQKANTTSAFALHLMPNKTFGKLFCIPGTIAAGTQEVDLTFFGKSSHIATPTKGNDALSAACAFYTKNQIQNLDQTSNGFLRFGVLQGGTARNALCATAQLKGTLRYFDATTRQEIQAKAIQTAKSTANDYGCTLSFDAKPFIPPVTNDKKLFDTASSLCSLYPTSPLYTGDDFGQYASICPILYTLLGAGDTSPLHSDTFNFDHSLLSIGLKYFTTLLTAQF